MGSLELALEAVVSAHHGFGFTGRAMLVLSHAALSPDLVLYKRPAGHSSKRITSTSSHYLSIRRVGRHEHSLKTVCVFYIFYVHWFIILVLHVILFFQIYVAQASPKPIIFPPLPPTHQNYRHVYHVAQAIPQPIIFLPLPPTHQNCRNVHHTQLQIISLLMFIESRFVVSLSKITIQVNNRSFKTTR